MFSMMVHKELRSVYAGSKTTAVFAVCTLLMCLSVYLGIREYRSAAAQYAAANELAAQEMREARQWTALNNRIYREPDPLQIFASGIQNDIGRFSTISSFEPVKLVHSAYSDDPIFAVFRFIDASFIVQVVFTLLAILFTYDAVNGEREGGTLLLVFSNAVPRVRFLLAKFTGLWLGLAVPVVVSFLLSALLLTLFGVPMTADGWARYALMCGISMLLVTFFIAFGVLVSALTRRSSTSFLILLVCWAVFVLIIPRAGVMAAGHLVRVPTAAEAASRQDVYAKQRWDALIGRMSEVWKGRQETMRGMNESERDAFRKEHESAWNEQDDAERKLVQKDIDEQARLLNEGMRNSRAEQERLAMRLSGLSPVAVCNNALMQLAGTDLRMKALYEDALASYRRAFNAYKDRMRQASGALGGIRITFDSDKGLKIDTGRDIALDLSGVPQFRMDRASVVSVLPSAAASALVLAAEIVLALACAFIAFVRSDIR